MIIKGTAHQRCGIPVQICAIESLSTRTSLKSKLPMHSIFKLSLTSLSKPSLLIFLKSDCLYSPLKLLAHSATLRLLSSSDKSSILVIIDHLTPQGSNILPNRSPETKFVTGSLTFAPLATAFSNT